MEQLTPEQIKALQEIGKLPPDEQRKRLPDFLKTLSPGQMEFLKQQQQQPKEQQCIFCKIISNEIPSKVVYDSSDVLAFLDIKPANPGHVLVIPKEHYQFLSQIPDNENAALFNAVKALSSAVLDATGADGVEIRQRNGEAAGQVVPHVHVHVIPRFKNDGVPTDWTPKELTDEQFTEMQKRISENMKGSGEVREIPKPKKREKLPKVPPRIP